MRVIGGAASASLAEPADADARAKRLGLPTRYIVTVGDSAARHGIGYLLSALAAKPTTSCTWSSSAPSATPVRWMPRSTEAGSTSDRVLGLGALDDADYATALSRAAVLVHPTLANGFGLPMLEAFALGVPVIHAGTPSLVEVAGDAGVAIPVDDLARYPGLLAEAIARVTERHRASHYAVDPRRGSRAAVHLARRRQKASGSCTPTCRAAR